MASVDLKTLVGKLNASARGALEAAAGLALSRTNYNVELEHWLLKSTELQGADIPAILARFGVDGSRVVTELTACLDRLRTGNGRAPGLAPQIVSLVREAWLLASLDYGAGEIRTGHLLATLLSDATLGPVVREASPTLGRIDAEALRRDLAGIVQQSLEEATKSVATTSAPSVAGGDKALDRFTVDLTRQAAEGKIDSVLGRDDEIRQIADILMRRRQNNPILTGEAGVGKTAVVEGFALRVVAGDVPPALRSISIRLLDLGLLQAGAGMKGEFENRLKSVIEEVKASPTPIVLFIDEAHTLIGAGGAAGQGDAANLLKPALARGELRTIAATTWAEYKRYFERDAALARRFQVIKVEEPDERTAILMLRGLLGTLEKHHGVRILEEALTEAVRLSMRYLTSRQLPDKAVSVLDTACARVAMSQAATPPQIEDLKRRLEQIALELQLDRREAAAGADHAELIAALSTEQAEAGDRLALLQARWEQEKALVERIRPLRQKLEAESDAPSSDTAENPSRTELAALSADLAALQGENPLVQVCVDAAAVSSVIAAWTGIPVGRMVSNEIRAVLDLRSRLSGRIIGQGHALDAIAEAMRTSRAKLTDPRKPIGVFLMVGTSGVGKTETALALADLLYGGEQTMTVINMSEFKEEHKVSLLMGSPPGYVGYGEGGVLTEAVRRRPYSVVLLDEMEKAHPGIQDVFYQVFDKGILRDGEGRDIDFKNTVILMTSNAGTDTIATLCADPATAPDAAGLLEVLYPELQKTFKPAFLARVTVVPYFPLTEDLLVEIVRLQLDRVGKRVAQNYRAEFHYAPALLHSIAHRCQESSAGARNIEHILSRTVLPELANRFLDRMAAGDPVKRVSIGVTDADELTYEVS